MPMLTAFSRTACPFDPARSRSITGERPLPRRKRGPPARPPRRSRVVRSDRLEPAHSDARICRGAVPPQYNRAVSGARTLAAVPVEPAARSSSGRTSEAHPPNNPCPPKWGTPFHHCGTISRHSRMAAARRHAQPPQAPLSRRREGQRWPRRAGPARPTGGTSLNVALRGHGKAAGPATAPRRPRPGAGGQARRAVRSRACGRRA